MNRLGLTDFYNNRKRYIYDLVEAGILERTIPDKRNDPNQKYRRKMQSRVRAIQLVYKC